MPQLELEYFAPQIIWLVISFTVLWLLMAKLALPRIGLILEERQKRISDNLAMAENLKLDADAEIEAYETAISEGKEQARMIISEAIKSSASEAEKQTQECNVEISKMLKEAEERIESAKSIALENIQGSAIGITSDIIERITDKEIQETEVKVAVETTINSRR